MKAIILGAGQGKRLLPLTAEVPKALLNIAGRSLAEWQARELCRCGIEELVFVTGFNSAAFERALAALAPAYPGCRVRSIHNVGYASTDNLVSCWMARAEMTEDFVLLNGDTLFRAPLLRQLLASEEAPVTLAADRKEHYDEDDMKIRFDSRRLDKIGKTLPAPEADGESIGMILFRDEGPARFAAALEEAVREPQAEKRWYLSVIDALAPSGDVQVELIEGHPWCEVDYPLDLERARHLAAGWLNEERDERASAAGP